MAEASTALTAATISVAIRASEIGWSMLRNLNNDMFGYFIKDVNMSMLIVRMIYSDTCADVQYNLRSLFNIK